MGKAITLIDAALRLRGQMDLSILNLEIDQSLCSMCDICQFKWVVILNGYIKRLRYCVPLLEAESPRTI